MDLVLLACNVPFRSTLVVRWGLDQPDSDDVFSKLGSHGSTSSPPQSQDLLSDLLSPCKSDLQLLHLDLQTYSFQP